MCSTKTAGALLSTPRLVLPASVSAPVVSLPLPSHAATTLTTSARRTTATLLFSERDPNPIFPPFFAPQKTTPIPIDATTNPFASSFMRLGLGKVANDSNKIAMEKPKNTNAESESLFYSQQWFQPFDGRTDAGLIHQAKRVLQFDLGLTDPSILDEHFVWIGPYVDVPLSKTDYLAAGRFFNLRAAFPDLDYRAHDFRLASVEQVASTTTTTSSSISDPKSTSTSILRTVRCTCRITGTMRGELRLRTQVLPPTGQTMLCPPEALSITIDTTTGKVTKLCTGFCLDRLVGNTLGTTGIPAASIIASGASAYSAWEYLPPSTVLANILARSTPPLLETTNRLAPFPETVMTQLAKGLLATGMASQDPSLLSDSNFIFVTPTVGPLDKRAFLQSYAAQELSAYDTPNFSNYRLDPYDAQRVWLDFQPTGRTNDGFAVRGPPQAMSLSFDKDGYCTRITSWAVLDPTIGNAGGLGGPEGYKYANGQGSLGVFTRPLPRALGRLRRRALSPLTGVDVDDYSLNAMTRNSASLNGGNIPSVVGRVNGESSKFTPVRPLSPPPESIATISKSSIATKNADATMKEEAVVARLDQLKDLASSIRIVPPDLSKSFPLLPEISKSFPLRPDVSKSFPLLPDISKSFPLLPAISKSFPLLPDISKSFPLLPSLSGDASADSSKATRDRAQRITTNAKEMIERVKRDSTRRDQQQAADKAREIAALKAKRKRDAIAHVLLVQKQAQQDALERRRKAEAERNQRELESRRRSELDRQRAVEMKQQEQQAKARRETVAVAAAEAKRAEAAAKERQADIDRNRRQAEQKRIAEIERKRATEQQQKQAIEAEVARKAVLTERKENVELKRREAAVADIKKLQLAREQQQAEESRRSLVAKVKLADIAAKISKRNKLGSKAPSSQSPQTPNVFSIPSFGATISLFGLGKRDLEDLPAAQTTLSGKKAPTGVPTLKRWRKNVDMTVSGLVFGARSFDDSTRITTSPIAGGSISSGQVVRTGSGTRYYLE